MATTAPAQAVSAAAPVKTGRGLELIGRMSPYWDSHMAVPVLDWMLSNNIISQGEHDSMKKKFEGEGISNPEKRASLEAEAAEIEKQLVNFNQAIAAYKKEQQKRIGGYPERKSVVDLSEWWQVNAGQTPRPPALEIGVEGLIPRLAKIYYDLGEYKLCLQQLQYVLTTLYELTVEGTNMQTRVACYWGMCACMIMQQQSFEFTSKEESEGKSTTKDQELLQRIEGAAVVVEDETDAEAAIGGREKEASTEPHVLAQCILKLGDLLDQAAAAANRKDQDRAISGIVMTRKEQLLDHSWLLHWAIWPVFCYYSVAVHAKQFVLGNQAWSMLIEWMMSEANLFCVAVICPHLLRYYAVYAILNRKRKDHFQAAMTALGQSKNRYSDPFTSLLEALFLDFNFDEAQLYIAQIGQECETDFFLHPLKAAINEYARLLIFETYCRIHKCINVDMIAKKVNMSPEAAERWIVNLIRNARLEARIDSEKNRVQMSAAPPNLYQHVIDKTRNLCIRSNMIMQNISRPTGFVREGDDSVAARNVRARNRGRQWVQGVGMTEGGGYPRGGGRGRGGRGGRRDPMAAVAASMASRRQDDTAFAE